MLNFENIIKNLFKLFFVAFLTLSIVGGCGGGGDDDDGGEDPTPMPTEEPTEDPTEEPTEDPTSASGTGTIRGTVRSSSGTFLNGVHVRAVNVNDNNVQIGAFSGLDSDFNIVNGTFSIQNVPAGNYRVLIERMDNRSGAFQPNRVSVFVVAAVIGQPSFPDEYFNGVDESANDDPNDSTVVSVNDGQVTNGIDFITND